MPGRETPDPDGHHAAWLARLRRRQCRRVAIKMVGRPGKALTEADIRVRKLVELLLGEEGRIRDEEPA
jgi:hypothetical protein